MIGLLRRCRWCKHMVSVGDEGSMHCEFGICKDDKTAVSCSQFKYFYLREEKSPHD